MTAAAFFLITHNLKNRFVRSVRRLRQPRYIAGAALAGFYFYSFLFRAGGTRAMATRAPAMRDFMVMIITILALAIILGAWALASEEVGLVFSEAEIQFFFAGPVTRRQLLAYKIARSQVQGIVSAVIFSFFVFRGSHIVGMWVAFVALDVYTTFVSFARARLKQAGVGWLWRLAAVASVVITIGFVANRQIRRESDTIVAAIHSSSRGAIGRVLTTIAQEPPLGTILFVPRIVALTVYSSAPLQPALILLAAAVVLFFMTSQIDIAFEDASIVTSQRVLARRAAMRASRFGRGGGTIRRIRPPFQLAESGRAEVALIWKNLIGTLRMSPMPMLMIFMPLGLATGAAVFGRHAGVADGVGLMGLMMTAVFVFVGPQAVRTDLRTEIARLDVIKTFPLSAEALLASELAAPLLTIALFELALLLVSVVVLQFGQSFPFFATPEFVVSALVFIIPISAMQLLIQNGAIILFPAWTMGPDSVRGFTAMGQRMLMLLGTVIILALALIPAAALFLPSLWIVHKTLGAAPAGILVATIPAAAVLVAEIFIAHKFLAAQFEEIDIANDLEA